MTGGGVQPPGGIDPSRPNPARVYDALLGGKDHYSVDRRAADEILAAVPTAGTMARANRAFLQRAVRFLAAEAGIRQFIDIGTGLPTQGNVHQIAQASVPDARVIYVDNDPVELAHGRALLAILHFVTDEEDPSGIVAHLRDAMVPGSYLVMSHATADFNPEAATKAARAYDRASVPIVLRSRAEIDRLFQGLELVGPGLVQLAAWRPDESPTQGQEKVWAYAGAARKRPEGRGDRSA